MDGVINWHCSLPSAELPVSKIGTASLLIYLLLGIEIRVLVSVAANCLGNETQISGYNGFVGRDLS